MERNKLIRLYKNHGQVSLELGIAFVCIFLILMGSFNVCLWFITRFTIRQQGYEATRTSGGSSYNQPTGKLDIFRKP